MISFTIIQIPSKENDYTAIVQGELKTQNGTVTDFGATNANAEGTENIETLLSRARENAQRRVERNMSGATSSNGENKTDFYSEDTSRKEFNHNPNKSISENQIKLINKLAGEKHRNINELCVNNYGKSLHELNSKEAHELIDSLKKR